MLLNVAVMAAVIALLGGGIVVLMDHELVAQASSELRAEARHATEEIRTGHMDDFRARHRSYATGTFYVLWSASGSVVFDPAGAPTARLRGPATLALRGHATTQRLDLTGDLDTLVASEPVYTGGRLSGAVQVGRSAEPIRTLEEQAIAIVATASAGALVLGVLAGWFLAGRALRPVRRAMERQRDFTADASHELRTPLATVDAGIQLLRRHPGQTISENEEVLEMIGGEAQRMGRLVASLLALARADSGEAELHLADVDVDELVGATAREVTTAIGGEPWLRLTSVAAGTARLDGDRFKQLLLILVQNAQRYSPPGQAVEVSCTRQDRNLVLEVADHGPGIPAQLRDRVFERFHRADVGQSPGSGLGLPIARWIVTAHGGSITLHDNQPGLRVHVLIPTGRRAHRPARRGVARVALLRRSHR